MRVFIISLSIALLFFQSEKAHAVDRAVVGYIIAEEWYNNIFLIADKVDSMAYKNFTVQIGDGGGGEHLFNFPDWYNDKFTPKLFYEDINNDRQKDVIVSLISGAGVSVSTKEIHVLNQYSSPRLEEVPVEPLNDAVKRLVKIERNGNDIMISIGKKMYVVDYSKFGYSTPVDSPGIGSFEVYEPRDGILYGWTNVFVSIPEAYIGSFKVTYEWDGKMYKAKNIIFEEEVPTKR